MPPLAASESAEPEPVPASASASACASESAELVSALAPASMCASAVSRASVLACASELAEPVLALASASACPSLPPSASVSAEPGSESAVATSKPAGEEQSDRDRLLQSDALSERKLHEVAEASASRIE